LLSERVSLQSFQQRTIFHPFWPVWTLFQQFLTSFFIILVAKPSRTLLFHERKSEPDMFDQFEQLFKYFWPIWTIFQQFLNSCSNFWPVWTFFQHFVTNLNHYLAI
jgi:hypothetical protein